MSQGSQPNPFLDAVRQAAQPPQNLHQEVMDVLQEFCDAVATYPNGRLQCLRVPGFVTNLGQEYRIIVKSQPRNFEHLLLRAHVPSGGLPVLLDLYDEDLIPCKAIPDLRQTLLDFLNRDATTDVLRTLAA
jgi:hypothetical protein